jgi:HK97 family phage prohead protease
MEHEKRFIRGEVRAIEVDGQPVITGISPVFNVPSDDLGGFREIILPGALDNVLEDADVRGRYDHDLVLGRAKNGTLKMDLRSDGLHYEIHINSDDADAMAAYARVKRGDVDGSSFMFSVAEKGDTWQKDGEGNITRYVRDFAEFLDVGPVAYPAYPQSTAYTRSRLTEINNQQKEPTPEVGSEADDDTKPQARRKLNRQKLELEKAKGGLIK